MQTVVRDFVDEVLGGSVSPLTPYLVETENLDDEDLARLRSLVEELGSRHKDPKS
jgi:predicted transcriptional regulator